MCVRQRKYIKSILKKHRVTAKRPTAATKEAGDVEREVTDERAIRTAQEQVGEMIVGRDSF